MMPMGIGGWEDVSREGTPSYLASMDTYIFAKYANNVFVGEPSAVALV